MWHSFLSKMAKTKLLYLQCMVVVSLLDPLSQAGMRLQMLQVLKTNGSHLHSPQEGLPSADRSHCTPCSLNPCGSWWLIDGGGEKCRRMCISTSPLPQGRAKWYNSCSKAPWVIRLRLAFHRNHLLTQGALKHELNQSVFYTIMRPSCPEQISFQWEDFLTKSLALKSAS